MFKKIKKILLNLNKKESGEEKSKKSVFFDTKTIYNGHHKITYRNIKAIRCPFDYVLYQMIICEIKPDLIIEIGTNIGGGALYLADILETIGNGILHTIDIKDQSNFILKQHKRIKTFYDGWQKYDLKQTTGFKKILVIEDGSHTYEETLGALEKFSEVVSLNSYFIVEDGIINELGLSKKYNGGPIRAIKEFTAKNTKYIVDRKWCDFFGKNATFNVDGYLKRIR
ncbi:MAG TPA: CmcI family methyltransferase [Candidatus Paceibacterota bacterium]|nr:CmcI family methyltransferase [Candidatus Paceibacterota bacterium]HMP19087.1 CmcI family methyltransferase [Candidatus Paceibacterota bacterium]